MLKAFKYRLYPTERQKILISKHFGCVRWIYNWVLAEKMNRYIEAGENVSVYELQSHIPELKDRPDTAWLSEVSAQSLCGAIMHVDGAYTRFFRGQASFPCFKKRGHRDSFQNHQGNQVNFGLGHFYCRKFTEGIKCNFTRPFEGKIKTCTVSRTAADRYFVSILVETPEVEPVPPPKDETTAIGLDFGLKNLVVTSDGQRFNNPRYLLHRIRRLKQKQRRFAKMTKGSKRRERMKLRIARIHEKVSNIRRDHLHKLSHELVRKNQATTICIEDLSVQAMLKNRHLSRSIQDVGWGELRRQLTYKCRWYGKNLRVIGRFEPSSKTCSYCGTIKSNLTLGDRQWTCLCGAHHDRDINAARNIKTMAFREQNTYSVPTGSREFKLGDRCVSTGMNRECLNLDENLN